MVIRAAILNNNTIENIILVEEKLLKSFNAIKIPEDANIGDSILEGKLVKPVVTTEPDIILTDEEIDELLSKL